MSETRQESFFDMGSGAEVMEHEAHSIVKTEGFQKTVAFTMSAMEMIWNMMQKNKRFRIVVEYDEEALNVNLDYFIPKTGREHQNSAQGYKFTPEEFDSKEELENERAFRWSMTKQSGTDDVIISPMDGTNAVTIHGEREAMLFTKCLLDCFLSG